uniref:Fungal specific transcription factor domain-containing protein n=1 Tax=uncultured bacterium lac193 TaxID=1447243 RepID=X2LCI4_9BACT|nr:fungal specific transcription factor domain-containing protein [uncultured bacterium lac193]
MTAPVCPAILSLVVLALAVVPAGAGQLVQPSPTSTVQDPSETTTGSGAQPDSPPPRRPYRGLFGGSEANTAADGLGLNLSGFGGYDGNVIADQQGSVGARRPVAGSYGGGAGTLSYLVRGNRSSFGVAGTSQLRVYRASVAPAGTMQSLLMTATVPLARRVTLNIRQGVQYSPYYQLSIMPDLPSQDAPDVAAVDLVNVDQSVTAVDTWGSTTAVSAAQELGRSSTMRYEYGYRLTDFAEGPDDRHGQNAGVSFSRRMTRYATLRLGYEYQTAESRGGLNRTQVHNLDLGGGYSRPLSFSRRTTVGFSGGTTVLQSPARGSQVRILGDATVHHEMGRSWLARFVVRQDARYVEALPHPLYGYTSRGGVSGLITPRVELTIDGGYSSGRVDSGRANASYSSGTGTARVRLAVTRTLAWYTEYAYHQYAFGSGTGLAAAVAPDFQRHAVRAGLTLWIPIFTPRQGHATR